MNAGMAYAHESHFGPPSEPIQISSFIQQVIDLESRTPMPCETFNTARVSLLGQDPWTQLSEEQRNEIASDCRRVTA
jgi:snRNA-activating protein complex subunit 3